MTPTEKRYDWWRNRFAAMAYSDLVNLRNRLTRDLASGYVYRLLASRRSRAADACYVAWANAEIARRVWATPWIKRPWNQGAGARGRKQKLYGDDK